MLPQGSFTQVKPTRHEHASVAHARMRAVRMGGFFERFRHGSVKTVSEAPASEETVVTIDASSLSRVFSAPMWLRDLGPVSYTHLTLPTIYSV